MGAGIIILVLAPVAQLDRVSDYESEGRGFESLPAHQGFPEMGNLFLLLSPGRRSVSPGRDSNSSSGRFMSRPVPTVQRTVGKSAGRGAPSGAPWFPRNGKPFLLLLPGRRSVSPGRDSNSSSGRFTSRPGLTVQRTVEKSAGRGAPSGASNYWTCRRENLGGSFFILSGIEPGSLVCYTETGKNPVPVRAGENVVYHTKEG